MSLLAGCLPDRVRDLQERERDRSEAMADRSITICPKARLVSCLDRKFPVVAHACSSRRRTATYNTAPRQQKETR
jgi:hypothetical protein